MRRLPYALALVTALSLAVPAHAAGCPLLVDPAGDSTFPLGLPVLHPDELDIRSADVASGPTTVVAVLRVTSLELKSVASALGEEWTVHWHIGSIGYAALARSPLLSDRAYSWAFTRDGADGGPVDAGPVALTVDRTAGTFTWVIPRSYLPELATPGATFTPITAVTWDISSTVDTAYTPTSYVDQSPGCVPAS
jgi:hypothetical protein